MIECIQGICHSKNSDGSIEFLHRAPYNKSFAFEICEKITLRAKIPRSLGTRKAILTVYNGDAVSPLKTFDLNWISRMGRQDLYEVSFDGKVLEVGLYFLEITLKSFSSSLVSTYLGNGVITFDTSGERRFQLTVSEFKYNAPDQLYGGIIYQIFVDRFSRGNGIIKSERFVYPESWDVIPEYPQYPGAPLKNNTLYGGNLYGVISKLPYLKNLGVNILYLTPIFESASNHKYDTGDYMRVDECFGGDEALKLLVSEAKKSKIFIILDGVFNHTGANSIYFNKNLCYNSVGAYNSKNSIYHNWYTFEHFPDDYECWWGIDILPRISPKSSEFQRFIADKGGVLERYMLLGVSGFRLDVVDELSDQFVEKIKTRLNYCDNRSVLYGEVWEDASNKRAYGTLRGYYLGSQLDGVMNYPLRKGIVEFITAGKTNELLYALTDVLRNAPERIVHAQMNLLGSHDTARILTVLSANAEDAVDNNSLAVSRLSHEDRTRGIARLKVAYTILATLPGIPMIYYGDEAGLQGYSDPFNRLPYPWGREDTELLELYRKVGRMRRSNSVYKRGAFRLIYIDRSLLLFSRLGKEYVYLTVANLAETMEIHFDSTAIDMLSGRHSTHHTLQTCSASVFKIKKETTIFFKVRQ